jgi:hypothetical protein
VLGQGSVKLRDIRTPGQNFHAKKTQFFLKKAFQTNFLHFFKQAKIFKKFLSQEQKRSGKVYSPRPFCPQGILVFSPVFILFFYVFLPPFSFYFFSALAENLLSY